MALAGFPDKIKVTLGSAWSGQNGLSSGQEIVLTKASEGSGAPGFGDWKRYTEDGTLSANTTSNRLLMMFSGGAFGTNGRCGVSPANSNKTGTVYNAGSQWSLQYVSGFTHTGGGNIMYYSGPPVTPTYTFKGLFSMGSANSYWDMLYGAGFLTASTGIIFNPNIFSTMEEFVEPSNLEPDKTTFHHG